MNLPFYACVSSWLVDTHIYRLAACCLLAKSSSFPWTGKSSLQRKSSIVVVTVSDRKLLLGQFIIDLWPVFVLSFSLLLYCTTLSDGWAGVGLQLINLMIISLLQSIIIYFYSKALLFVEGGGWGFDSGLPLHWPLLVSWGHIAKPWFWGWGGYSIQCHREILGYSSFVGHALCDKWAGILVFTG